ncbi:MAG: lipoprotein [Polynucleobacter sp.]|nr:lipoprotein [Polynucleobacter sp.]
MISSLKSLLLILCLIALTGCGVRGPLYLPSVPPVPPEPSQAEPKGKLYPTPDPSQGQPATNSAPKSQ